MAREERRAAAERALTMWRDKLVNLTGRNRLLNFTETKSSTVSITEPPLGDVLNRLAAHDSLEFVALREPPDDGPADDLGSEPEVPRLSPSERVEGSGSTLGANHDPAVLSAALRNLLTKTNQTLLDTGLWTLYLALGTLTWSEPDDPSTSYRSPIVLWPVSLRRPGRRMAPVLSPSLEDAVVNPALVLKMATLDLEFPGFADITEGNVEAYLQEVADLARGREGWKVGAEVAMSYFTFHKEAMYRDLQDNMDEVLASPRIW